MGERRQNNNLVCRKHEIDLGVRKERGSSEELRVKKEVLKNLINCSAQRQLRRGCKHWNYITVLYRLTYCFSVLFRSFNSLFSLCLCVWMSKYDISCFFV